MLIDEPLSNLNAKFRRRVRKGIRELQQKLELTTTVRLFVSDFFGVANLVKSTILEIEGSDSKVDIEEIGTQLPHHGLTPGYANV